MIGHLLGLVCVFLDALTFLKPRLPELLLSRNNDTDDLRLHPEVGQRGHRGPVRRHVVNLEGVQWPFWYKVSLCSSKTVQHFLREREGENQTTFTSDQSQIGFLVNQLIHFDTHITGIKFYHIYASLANATFFEVISAVRFSRSLS